MENIPTVCASDLFTNIRIFKNDRKSRSVNSCFQWQDLDPNMEQMQAKTLPRKGSRS